MASALVVEHHLVEPLAALERRARRLANVVTAISRRRDVRETRAKLILVLLEHLCPEGGRPLKPWYVPGAVARFGIESLQRAWKELFGEEAPVERSIRSHLAVLEAACAIARQPGDWLPYLFPDEDVEKRPRYPDTIHLLLDDREAEWWEVEGARILREHPGVRRSPRVWRLKIGDWRAKARTRQLELFPQVVRNVAAAMRRNAERGAEDRAGNPHAPNRALHADPKAGEFLLAALRRRAKPAELLGALHLVQVRIGGTTSWRCLRAPERFRGAIALLASALMRGDRVRSRAAWLMGAFNSATDSELAAALERAGA